MELKTNITKEELADYPKEEFSGKIYVIQTESDADKAVAYLKTQPIVGFDTETRPAFVKGKTNQVALMQLSTDTQCFLFRLNVIGIPDSLVEFLKDPSVKKIGLSLKDDFRSLNKKKTVELANFVELQTYVKSFGIEDNSLMKIYAIIFGKRISKAQRLTNWEADLLTERQQKYAALDAWASRYIYIKLESMQKDVNDKIEE
ncbi:MAG TPA: 3'-5' exonuclease [Paludibacteraceae bacterium]|nr:3'-5' exonuclease [Paludibacteraceae bacterium]HQF50993.1 3'-5' exonuclease [Paludibacteraceae bacterium]HQJ89787.1 3'-5' exonuclease [Paludibacteraceae bacterium]